MEIGATLYPNTKRQSDRREAGLRPDNLPHAPDLEEAGRKKPNPQQKDKK